MSTETETKRLSAEDPVDKATLDKLAELENARFQIGGQLLEIEQERVRLLAAAHQVDQQRQRLFEKVLLDRGLPPNAGVEINSSTGILKIHSLPGVHVPAPVPPGAPAQAPAPNGGAAPTP